MEWISVEDRLPVGDKENLIICLDYISDFGHPYTSNEAQSIAFYSNGHWWDAAFPEAHKEDNIIADVTHWQPLPEPPIKDKNLNEDNRRLI